MNEVKIVGTGETRQYSYGALDKRECLMIIFLISHRNHML